MGHYYSEMYSDDRSDQQKKEDAEKYKRRKELEKVLLKKFKCTKKELHVIYDILKESRWY